MPLFGSKHKHDRDTIDETGVAHQHLHNERVPGGNGAQGPNNYDDNGRPYEHPYQGAGPTGPQFRQDNQFRQQDYRDPYGQPQTGAGSGPNAGFPAPSGGMYHGDPDYNHPTGGGGGTGTKFLGKAESALGTMIGSQSLKAKGLEKEREANNATMQGLHLAEAERLEREALMHRQNAAGQGAHPANAAAPGAGQFSSGFGPTGVQPRPGGGTTGGYPQ